MCVLADTYIYIGMYSKYVLKLGLITVKQKLVYHVHMRPIFGDYCAK